MRPAGRVPENAPYALDWARSLVRDFSEEEKHAFVYCGENHHACGCGRGPVLYGRPSDDHAPSGASSIDATTQLAKATTDAVTEPAGQTRALAGLIEKMKRE